VLELAWFVIDFCGVSTLRKLCAICSNSVDKSSALMYGDASDTPQVPYPCVDRSRLTVSDAYWTSYAECRHDDSSHMQSRRHCTLHSYHSNARRSQSVPSIIIYTLVSYVIYLSLIIFKIIPHPMTLLIAIPLQVIILHFI
jgi:hypothetical protein